MNKKQIRINGAEPSYFFSIYPAAYLPDQEIGHSSKMFSSSDECLSALKDFVSFIKSKNIQFGNDQYIKYEKRGDSNHNKFGFYFVDDSGTRIFESGFRYERKQNCKNGIIGVINAARDYV